MYRYYKETGFISNYSKFILHVLCSCKNLNWLSILNAHTKFQEIDYQYHLHVALKKCQLLNQGEWTVCTHYVYNWVMSNA